MMNSWTPIQFQRTGGESPVVLVCEHASCLAPRDFGDLGLNEAARASHAVWDLGALEVARGLSDELDAPLAWCGVSRALYDCNRPPTAPDSIPSKSETIAIPGNEGLGAEQCRMRRRLIHDPFHAGVAGLIASHRERFDSPVAIVTVHSFTPVYHGKTRDVEIGFLHHGKAALSVAAREIEAARGIHRTELNQPYDSSAGVTYTLDRHADANQLHSTMVEIKNDLIDTDDKARNIAVHLAETLRRALARVALPEMAGP